MEKLEQYIKEYNLVFTETIKEAKFWKVDIDKVDVDYTNSVSFFHFVSSFNKLYLSFKEEYEQLENLNLGEHVDVIDFCEYEDGREIRLEVYNPYTINVNDNDPFVYLYEDRSEIGAYADNHIPFFDEEYRKEELKIDKAVIKKYLDLFKKYDALFIAYNYFKNRPLFSDGISSISTSIDNYNSYLLDGLKTFNIVFGVPSAYYFLLSIKLGNDFGINYDECKLMLDGSKIDTEEETWDKLLTKVYVNKKYTEVIK